VIPLDERHLERILTAYVDSYNRDRPHRTLHLQTPHPRDHSRAGPPQVVRARPVLSGLHHVYESAAA